MSGVWWSGRPLVLGVALAARAAVGFADPAATLVLHLSGRSAAEPVDWEFSCVAGRGCGAPATIPVPANWELHGFGAYNYGLDRAKTPDAGRYRHRFVAPASFARRQVDLVFEGVMTDALVSLNGRSLGPRHQGGFYRFAFDVTPHLVLGGMNVLEVTVDEQSADASVERAERTADYWVFGGIYRPVYLRAAPAEAMVDRALAADAAGRLRARVSLRGLQGPATLRLQVLDRARRAVGAPVEVPAVAGEVPIAAAIDAPAQWTAETPNLYTARFELRRGERLLHWHEERFGFRTVLVRAGAGLLVNGQRVLLRGINRHAFWPGSARALDPALDRADVLRIKSLNLNAVRLSHYPPDPEFLDACDEFGLYVIDELAGWHDAYDTGVGRELVRAMVERDRNHPSVVLWANGNEGGWNPALDAEFARADLERRLVIHPGGLFSGIDAGHYPSYQELAARLDDRGRGSDPRRAPPIVLPTEMLHGLYDGGGAAALEDYWRLIRQSPRAAGFFLWSLFDEAVVRTDHAGALDAAGNRAPDGVLGPRRESEGSAHALPLVLTPIAVSWDGEQSALLLENRFDHTDLETCTLAVSFERFGGESTPPHELVPPATPPGGSSTLALAVPEGGGPWDVVHVVARGPHRQVVFEQRFPLTTAREHARRVRARAATASARPAALERDGESVRLTAAGHGVALSPAGELLGLIHPGGMLVLPPLVAAGDLPRPLAMSLITEGGAPVAWVRYAGKLRFVRYRVEPSGWLRASWLLDERGPADGAGLVLPLDPERLVAHSWLGLGPARVWRNRRHGWFGEHRIEHPGARLTSAPGPFYQPHYEPQARGYFAARAATLELPEGRIELLFEDDGSVLGIGPPLHPRDAKNARAAGFAPAGVAFLDGLPAIGNKFHSPGELGPSSAAPRPPGLVRGAVWLRARPASSR